jgi:hypothetical protein
VVELKLPSQCAFTDSAHLRASCDYGDVVGGHVNVGMRAAAGAQGDLIFQVTATNAEQNGGTFPVRGSVEIGDGVDLANLQPSVVTRTLTNGDTVLSTGVVNRGTKDANGVIMYVYRPWAYVTAGSYSNCLYPPHTPGYMVCRFDDTVVHAGESVQLSSPVVVQGNDNPPIGLLEYGFAPSGSRTDRSVAEDGATFGTGAPLTLTTTPVQQDAEYVSGSAYTLLEADDVRDVKAIAPDIHATVGKVTSATFGVRNVGTVPNGPGSSGQNDLWVYFPEHVSVSGVPSGCVKGIENSNAHPQYTCAETHTLQPGETESFTFQVTPEIVMNQVTATASVEADSHDANPGNDTAFYTVTATNASASPTASATASSSASASASASVSASASATASAQPSASASGSDSATASASATATATSTGGGVLAHTGAGGTLALALAGGAALTLGTGAVVIARRRRADGRS